MITNTLITISDERIRKFALEADQAGDEAACHCAWVALGKREPGEGGQLWPRSQEEARQEVIRMIWDALAQE